MKALKLPTPGTKFGRWVVLGPAMNKGSDKATMCRCTCGAIEAIKTYRLRNGSALSCGCLRLEKIRKPAGEASRNAALNNIKQSARLRDKKIGITDGQILKMMNAPCYWCGRTKVNERRSRSTNGSFRYNGLDRLNNSQGYTAENTVPCCGPCNKAKSTLSAEEFIELCRLVVANNMYEGIRHAGAVR